MKEVEDIWRYQKFFRIKSGLWALGSETLSNCNAGISFHGVVQNIFRFSSGEKKCCTGIKHETSSDQSERVDIHYFTDLQTIISAKGSAKIHHLYVKCKNIHMKGALKNVKILSKSKTSLS